METIFHEKQEGMLCAQHCLNALLQGAYFSPVDLATLASRLDEQERQRMAEVGIDTAEYRQFIQQPSGNMDDSGFFSVQVLSSALEVWGLELVPFNSTGPLAVAAQRNPQDMSAFICNYHQHWFTIRKLGGQWFNLNSTLSGPELISTTYLSIFLAQLQQEGYSIFVVSGNLPSCIADTELRLRPAVHQPKPVKTGENSELEKAIKLSLGDDANNVDEDLAAAIQMSLNDTVDPSLSKAIEESLKATESSLTAPSTIDLDEIRRKRLAYLNA